MTLPMARPFKHPNSGVYWLRKRVPDDLRKVIGKREEKQSLGTRDPEEAKRLHAQALLELEARWTNLRNGARSLSREDSEGAAALLFDYYLAHHGKHIPDEFLAGLNAAEADKMWGKSIAPKLLAKVHPLELRSVDFPEVVIELEKETHVTFFEEGHVMFVVRIVTVVKSFEISHSLKDARFLVRAKRLE